MTTALHAELHKAAFSHSLALEEARAAAMKRGLTPTEADRIVADATTRALESHEGQRKPKAVPHTPGPFSALEVGGRRLLIVGPKNMPGDARLVVAEMGTTFDRNEMIANAKLFAGAPAVLAAAQKCLNWDDDDEFENAEVDHDAAFAELRAAVKASQHMA